MDDPSARIHSAL